MQERDHEPLIQTTRRQTKTVEVVRGVGDEVIVGVLDESCLHRCLRCKLAGCKEQVTRRVSTRVLRAAKVEQDDDDAQLRRPYVAYTRPSPPLRSSSQYFFINLYLA